MKLIALTFIALLLSCSVMSQDKKALTLYPLLSKSGKFGYCDSSGQLIIQAQFDDAQPFKNGYAIVGNNGRYGVIDQAQRTILPIKFPLAYFFTDGLFNLVITGKEYNAWWRFWQWRIMPEYNILSTRNHGPFLVTKVPKAKWTILSIPGKKVLFSQKRMLASGQYWKKGWHSDEQIPDMQISSAGNTLKVRDRLFVLNGKLRKTDSNVLELLDDSSALVLKNGKYVLSGKLKGTYIREDSIAFRVDAGKTVYVQQQSKEMYPYPAINALILKGHDGRTYLSPEISKPLPLHVEDYKGVSAGEIMTRLITLASIPGSPYFLVVSVLDNEPTCLLLDSTGKWNDDIPAYKGLDQMLSNGDLLLTRGAKKGVLTRDLEFKALPFDYRAYPLSYTKDLYSGKDLSTQLYGIFNTAKQEWQVAPQYSFIGNEISPGTCIYTKIKEDEHGTKREYYGLLDIPANKIITAPVYDMISNDGRVAITLNEGTVYFYINPVTGKEYREL